MNGSDAEVLMILRPSSAMRQRQPSTIRLVVHTTQARSGTTYARRSRDRGDGAAGGPNDVDSGGADMSAG